MRGTQVLTAVVIGAAAVISGCGQQHPSGSPSASPPASSPAGTIVVCHGGRATTAEKLTITAADNGQALCVRRGTIVTVLLKGTAARKWAPVRATPGGVLAPHANGEMTLALGVTGASFEATQPGTAVITSGRPVCGPGVPPGDSATGTGTLSCDAIIAFRVTVTVVS